VRNRRGRHSAAEQVDSADCTLDLLELLRGHADGGHEMALHRARRDRPRLPSRCALDDLVARKDALGREALDELIRALERRDLQRLAVDRERPRCDERTDERRGSASSPREHEARTRRA
jgi:hypothetical protein